MRSVTALWHMPCGCRIRQWLNERRRRAMTPQGAPTDFPIELAYEAIDNGTEAFVGIRVGPDGWSLLER